MTGPLRIRGAGHPTPTLKDGQSSYGQPTLLPASDYRIEVWPITRVVRQPDSNPRVNQRAVPKVMRSLSKSGWRKPLVCTPDGKLWAGDTRFLAALALGLRFVPVRPTTLSELAARGYRLDDNRTGDFSEWDYPGLHLETRQLEQLGADLAGLTFDPDELMSLADRAAEAELTALAASDPGQMPAQAPYAGGTPSGLVTFHLLVRPAQRATILAACARAKLLRRLPLTADALVAIATDWRDQCQTPPPSPPSPVPAAKPRSTTATARSTPPTRSAPGKSPRSTARSRPTSRRGTKGS